MGKPRKIIALLISFCFIFEQTGFAQLASSIDMSGLVTSLASSVMQDKYRPLHLRYLAYDQLQNNLQLLLDKGDTKETKPEALENTTSELLKYFFVGVTLPDDTFWVNLRPDSPNEIINVDLARTDVGRILLEADLQLKKDTAKYTSPQTREGRDYWDKLYKKAEQLYASENISIPTLTRPWIVPDEIIVREAQGSAYIYKATLKVMLEQDYLKGNSNYSFPDTRSKELNEYSSQLIRETIIPKLTKEINSAKRYASLRQVYYSLILAQWFKEKYKGDNGTYSRRIDTKDLTNLASKTSWNKDTYFKAYQKSFKDGEYNIKEPRYTSYGQSIRSYFSGGMDFALLRRAIAAGLIRSSRMSDMPKFCFAATADADGGINIEQSQANVAPKKIAYSVKDLPSLPQNWVRLVHMTGELAAKSITETGLSYENYGMVSSTAAMSDADPSGTIKEGRRDPRYSHPSLKAVIIDMPTAEYRIHNDPTRSPGIVPAKYVVGVLNANEFGEASTGQASQPTSGGGTAQKDGGIKDLIPGEDFSVDYHRPVVIKLAPDKMGASLRVLRYLDIPGNYPGKEQLNPLMGYFIIQEGHPGGFKALRDGETVEIGRENNGRFNFNSFISRKHVSIKREGDKIIIRDLGSSNGTRVELVSPKENESSGAEKITPPTVGKKDAFVDAEIQRVVRFGEAIRQGKYQDRAVVDLRDIPADVEIIMVGDLHGKVKNLKKILLDNENLQKIEQKKAVLVILGDAVHNEDDLVEMDSSIETMRLIMQLKIANRDNVYYLLGNHDYLTDKLSKGNIQQGLVYKKALQDKFGEEYIQGYEKFIQSSPLMVIGKGFISTHAGPIREKKGLEEIKKTDVLKEKDSVVHQALWGRYLHPKYYYNLDDVNQFLASLGLKKDDILIVGHSPKRDGYWHWKISDNHHIIFAAEERVGYASAKSGKVDFIEVKDGGAPVAQKDGGIGVERNEVRNQVRKVWRDSYKKMMQAWGERKKAEETDQVAMQEIYAQFLGAYYLELRYNAEPYPEQKSENKDIGQAVSRDRLDSQGEPLVFVRERNGFYFRFTASSPVEATDPLSRVSMNVYAHDSLIEGLDKFFVKNNIKGYYKAAKNYQEWSNRHDPITLYFWQEITPAMKKELVAIAQEHIRSDKKVFWGEELTPGIVLALEMQPEDKKEMINRVDEIDSDLGKAVLALERAQKGLSEGGWQAIRMVVEQSEQLSREISNRGQPQKDGGEVRDEIGKLSIPQNIAEYLQLSETEKDNLRQEFFKRFKVAPLVLSDGKSVNLSHTLVDDARLGQLVKAAEELNALDKENYPNARRASLGRSPLWFLDTARLLNGEIGKYIYAAFSGRWYYRNEPSSPGPNGAQIKAYRKYLERIRLSPQEIISRAESGEKTILIEFADSGSSLNSFLSILNNWANELDEVEALKKSLVIHILKNPKEIIGDFGGFEVIQQEIGDKLLWSLGDEYSLGGDSYPYEKWETTVIEEDYPLLEISDEAALLRFRIIDFLAGQGMLRQDEKNSQVGSVAADGGNRLDVFWDNLFKEGKDELRATITKTAEGAITTVNRLNIEKNEPGQPKINIGLDFNHVNKSLQISVNGSTKTAPMRYTKFKSPLTLDDISLLGKLTDQYDSTITYANLADLLKRSLGNEYDYFKHFAIETGFWIVYDPQAKKYEFWDQPVNHAVIFDVDDNGQLYLSYGITPAKEMELGKYQKIAEGHFHPDYEMVSWADILAMLNRAEREGRMTPEVIATFKEETAADYITVGEDGQPLKQKTIILTQYSFQYEKREEIKKALNELIKAYNGNIPIEILEKEMIGKYFLRQGLEIKDEAFQQKDGGSAEAENAFQLIRDRVLKTKQNAEKLSSLLKGKDVYAQYAGRVNDAIVLLERLEGFLDMSKDRQTVIFEPDKFGVEQKLKDIVDEALASQDRTGLAISPSVVTVSLYEFYFSDIFRNLMVNSAKYRSGQTFKINIDIKEDGDNVIITLTDNGQGMTAGEMVAFLKAEAPPQKKDAALFSSGTVSKLIAENLKALNGTLQIHSDGANTGTTFQIRLPKNIEGARQEKLERIYSSIKHDALNLLAPIVLKASLQGEDEVINSADEIEKILQEISGIFAKQSAQNAQKDGWDKDRLQANEKIEIGKAAFEWGALVVKDAKDKEIARIFKRSVSGRQAKILYLESSLGIETLKQDPALVHNLIKIGIACETGKQPTIEEIKDIIRLGRVDYVEENNIAVINFGKESVLVVPLGNGKFNYLVLDRIYRVAAEEFIKKTRLAPIPINNWRLNFPTFYDRLKAKLSPREQGTLPGVENNFDGGSTTLSPQVAQVLGATIKGIDRLERATGSTPEYLSTPRPVIDTTSEEYQKEYAELLRQQKELLPDGGMVQKDGGKAADFKEEQRELLLERLEALNAALDKRMPDYSLESNQVLKDIASGLREELERETVRLAYENGELGVLPDIGSMSVEELHFIREDMLNAYLQNGLKARVTETIESILTKKLLDSRLPLVSKIGSALPRLARLMPAVILIPGLVLPGFVLSDFFTDHHLPSIQDFNEQLSYYHDRTLYDITPGDPNGYYLVALTPEEARSSGSAITVYEKASLVPDRPLDPTKEEICADAFGSREQWMRYVIERSSDGVREITFVGDPFALRVNYDAGAINRVLSAKNELDNLFRLYKDKDWRSDYQKYRELNDKESGLNFDMSMIKNWDMPEEKAKINRSLALVAAEKAQFPEAARLEQGKEEYENVFREVAAGGDIAIFLDQGNSLDELLPQFYSQIPEAEKDRQWLQNVALAYSPAYKILPKATAIYDFRERILDKYGFTSEAAEYIRANSDVIFEVYIKNAGAFWSPNEKEVHLQALGEEAAVHEFSHAWYEQRMKEVEFREDFVRAFAQLANLNPEATPEYAEAIQWAHSALYLPEKAKHDSHTEPVSWETINNWTKEDWNKVFDYEMFASLASFTGGQYKDGPRKLPKFMWRFLEPVFTGEVKGNPYYVVDKNVIPSLSMERARLHNLLSEKENALKDRISKYKREFGDSYKQDLEVFRQRFQKNNPDEKALMPFLYFLYYDSHSDYYADYYKSHPDEPRFVFGDGRGAILSDIVAFENHIKQYQEDIAQLDMEIRNAADNNQSAQTDGGAGQQDISVPVNKGGIDLRTLPIVAQPMAASLSPAMNPLASVNIADLDAEWRQIEQMAAGGMIPSTERIREFLGVCCSKGELGQYSANVLACIAEIMRIEEEKAKTTESALKDILILLESDQPENMLQGALNRIQVVIEESKV